MHTHSIVCTGWGNVACDNWIYGFTSARPPRPRPLAAYRGNLIGQRNVRKECPGKKMQGRRLWVRIMVSTQRCDILGYRANCKNIIPSDLLTINGGQGGWLNSTDSSFCASHPVALSLYLRPPKKFQMKIPAQLIGVAETVDDTKDRFKKTSM